jgi:hypothetical protein
MTFVGTLSVSGQCDSLHIPFQMMFAGMERHGTSYPFVRCYRSFGSIFIELYYVLTWRLFGITSLLTCMDFCWVCRLCDFDDCGGNDDGHLRVLLSPNAKETLYLWQWTAFIWLWGASTAV